jgi:hypothetical protein
VNLRTVEKFFHTAAHLVGELADIVESVRGLERRVLRLEVHTGAPTDIDDLPASKQAAVERIVEKKRKPQRGAAKKIWEIYAGHWGRHNAGNPIPDYSPTDMAYCSNLLKQCRSLELAERVVNAYFDERRGTVERCSLSGCVADSQVLALYLLRGRRVSRSEAKRILCQEPGILKEGVPHG